MYKDIPDLQTEIDTCWVKVAGEDPAGYVRKYTGRVPVAHLKDFAGSKEENEVMFELIGNDKKTENNSGKFEFRPVGKGMQDVPELISAFEAAGAEWIIVEQDNPSMNLSPMACAEISLTYLKTL